MKTYSGELKEGMPYLTETGIYRAKWNLNEGEVNHIKEVYHDNEWQLYKPQPKKVWGIPELNQEYYRICEVKDRSYAYLVVAEVNEGNVKQPTFLSKEHAEQHAKALNMANEFRLLSDVPVDGVNQWVIDYKGLVYRSMWKTESKLKYGIFGVVFNTKEQAEQALAKFPQIHIANKIIQFGFHGIVEERL